MYLEKELVTVAKRENNKRRNYLVVNPLQGKHIPVMPGRALKLFNSLADMIKTEYGNERLLLIGFAETATAIGAEAAIRSGARYIQTTREEIPGVDYLLFSEVHSHAAEQKLVKDDIDRVIGDIDRIVFVEDEITTGNTIMNIVNILEEVYGRKLHFSAASILNGMTEEHAQVYREKGIGVHYILKINNESYSSLVTEYAQSGIYERCDTGAACSVNELCFDGWMDTRRLVYAPEYERACERLWRGLEAAFEFKRGERILVAGTEEFMFPALFIANRIEMKGCEAWSHSTTRSPAMVFKDRGYPLKTRYELKSFYDRDRVTFIYDIDSYDRVFIITDAHDREEEGKNSLINALMKKNNDINLIRWC